MGRCLLFLSVVQNPSADTILSLPVYISSSIENEYLLLYSKYISHSHGPAAFLTIQKMKEGCQV